MEYETRTRRKLIEVALPLNAINSASARDKSIRHGHPSTLHLWWARRPLAAARAVIFAQMVDDPSANPALFPTEKAQEEERERLFGIIRELVKWENTTNETVLQRAREEIRESWVRTCSENAEHPRAAELFDPDRLPTFHDPFAGGGALPLEAQRLGLEAYASDLNPVAVLINKAMIEKSPIPAFGDVDAPLASTFMLSTKKGKEAYVEPAIERRGYRFEVKVGAPPDPDAAKRGTKSGGSHSSFCCLMSGTPMPFEYLRAEANAGRLDAQLMAIVAGGKRGRVYLPAYPEQQTIPRRADPSWSPTVEISHRPGRTNVVEYGLTTFGDLFTSRQLVALTTFSDPVGETTERVRRHGVAAGLPDDSRPLRDGGTGATAYAEAVSVYLALALSKLADRGSKICTWFTERDSTRNTFARQSIPMTWDYSY